MTKSMPQTAEVPRSGQRGPLEHERRIQIIQAAEDFFKHFGYRKTSVTDLARAIGVSSAYIYKFFDSKQAIGEAICEQTLTRISAEVELAAHAELPAAQRLALAFRRRAQLSAELFFNERRLHDIVSEAVECEWSPCQHYREGIASHIRQIIIDGRQRGEFEAVTDLDEVCRGVHEALLPFAHPTLMAQTNPDHLDARLDAIIALVLRSLR